MRGALAAFDLDHTPARKGELSELEKIAALPHLESLFVSQPAANIAEGSDRDGFEILGDD